MDRRINVLIMCLNTRFLRLLNGRFSTNFINNNIKRTQAGVHLNLCMLMYAIYARLKRLSDHFNHVTLAIVVNYELTTIITTYRCHCGRRRRRQSGYVVPFRSLSMLGLDFASFFPASGIATTPFVDNAFVLAYPAKGSGRVKWSCSFAGSTGTPCESFPESLFSSCSIGYPVVEPRDLSEAPPDLELCVVHSATYKHSPASSVGEVIPSTKVSWKMPHDP